MKKATKIVAFVLATALLGALVVGCGSSKAASEDKKDDKKEVAAVKKGILVASFGTSYADTRKVTIEACEEKIKGSFPDYEVKRAFTSSIIRKILKDRDKIEVDGLVEALTKMKEEKFTDVIIQPLHIIPGEEYHEVIAAANKFKADFQSIVVGRPILTTMDDYRTATDALKAQLPELKKTQAVVFMGHGTHHPANSSYACLQMVVNDNLSNVYIGTVEGYPALDDVIKSLKKDGIKEVTLMPFMVVAGDHANNDMAGDEEDSWKTILKKEGFVVNTYLHGLGENKGIQDMYVNHVQDCIDGHPMGKHEE